MVFLCYMCCNVIHVKITCIEAPLDWFSEHCVGFMDKYPEWNHQAKIDLY